MCTCFAKSVLFHVLIEARVIVFRDNAEFVCLFSFAWVKPALGRGGSVVCPRDRGCRGQFPQAISSPVCKLSDSEKHASHAGV